MKIKIEKLDKSQIAITVTLPSKEVEKYRDEVENEFIKNIEVDGFRKGSVPKDIALKKIGEMKILEEMAQKSISENYVKILEKEKINAIGNPEIQITKIGEGSDLEFKIITAILPKIEIADYKKIAKEEMSKKIDLEVNEKEVEDAVLQLRRMKFQQDEMKDLKEGEVPTSINKIKDEDLPELDDEWIKNLGKFENIEEFKKKLKENLGEEKKAKEEEKRRISIIDTVIDKSEVEIPEMLSKFELNKMLHQLEYDIAMSGMKFEDYLEKTKKTKEDIEKEWMPQAEKRAKMQLLVNRIASEEKIEPSDKEVEEEVKKIMEQYKDSPEKIDENQAKAYVSTILINQKVFEYLEKQ